MTAVATAPTCEARVGFYAGEWSEMPVYCSARIGLTMWTDRNGTTRRACRHHLDAMRARFGVQEEERVARVISEASRPLRRFERPIVIEDQGAYVVTADLEDDPPAHDHFDIWDSTDDCPRCAFDQLRAEG